MTNQFRSLVLLPTIFLVVLFGAIWGKQYPFPFLILIVLICEHIFFWNNSIELKKFPDFRIFFIEQYLKVVYFLIIILNYLLSTIFWDQVEWWILFSYALNYLIFRSFAETGTEQINQLPTVKSHAIESNFDLWTSNKKKLTELIENCDDVELKEKILNQINYSSFLRTQKASKLISEAEMSSGDLLISILRSIESFI